MRFVQALLAAVVGFLSLAAASKHTLIVGTFSTNFLYTVEYDDVAQTLELIKKTATDAASSWTALSHDQKNLYGTDWNAEKPSFVSYSVKDDGKTIEQEARLFGDGDCIGKKSIFVTPSLVPPYAVYGNYFYGNAKCGTVMSVDENGKLDSVIQGYEYADGSAIHGVSFSNESQYLYSADDGGNSIWVHSINADGTIKYESRLDMPLEGAGPRHVVTHPGGEYMYTVFEGTSEVAQCITSELGNLYILKETFPLIKDGDKAADFWADEVALSVDRKYLWASNRAYDSDRKGYISALNLTEEGKIDQQLFLLETTSSGGYANAVSPSLFDDSIVAMTDNSTGFVEIWKMDDDEAGAKMVAHLDIDDGGCCANAIWYTK
ncbi:hypothetical protein M426DRAFT_14974 [Hypoxylon sp. CI-4A]|nr:hypothetical protein M426DRAFT_14974 [Hypoxylon sp. CI-4A]